MNLHRLLQQREAQGKPLRLGLIGAGKFGAMYLAQVPRTPGIHLVGIADLSPDNAKANLDRVGWDTERYGAASLDAALKERRHAPRRQLGGAGRASGHRHHRRGDRQSAGGGRTCAGCVQTRQARRDGHGRSRRVLRTAARQARGRGRRDLQPRVRRPAGADLRSGGLGARRGIPGGRRGPRPQMAAALRAVDAGDGVGLLRPLAGAGAHRRPESEDVQLVPRRLQARHREHRGRQRDGPHARARRHRVSAGEHRRHSVRHAAEERRRSSASQGAGRGHLVAGARWARDSVRHPLRRVGGVRGRDRVHPPLLLRVRRSHRSDRPLRVPLQALAPDRSRSRHLGRIGRSARRTHRLRRRASSPTRSRPPSAISSRARSSTARAATRSSAN